MHAFLYFRFFYRFLVCFFSKLKSFLFRNVDQNKQTTKKQLEIQKINKQLN